MNEIQYIGEHLWIGQIGHVAIILSFIASLLAAFSYSFSVNNNDISATRQWVNLGRTGYIIHGISTFTVIGLIFYAMYNHYYEYIYVFEHVSDDLPIKYVLSAFWEGQEGSFLLWIFWHVILGFILIYKKGEWESSVMAILSMVEVFLTSMLLGVHIEIGDFVYKLGINPMLLLRDVMDAPIFANADYLSLIEGNGLNPLLQNYWMTIHPPVTFLGFASTVIPFSFAIAGLWTGKYKEWLSPALGWCLFSAGILGTGILMGGLWAYEALSFGGYWAWDPVENAVLVPWLTLVAGIHTHLIAKKTGYSLRPTFFFYIISFILIVYSTFLTRSGILGDTSVHAFTEMGLETMLIVFQVFFLFLGFGWFFYRYKHIPAKAKEESIYSREFWMFIGSLVLLFSAVLISWSTSLPVFNSIASYFNEDYIGRVIQDPIEHYNKYQLWIAVFIAVISSKTIFLRYNERNFKSQFKRYYSYLLPISLVSLIVTYLVTIWIDLFTWQYLLLCFASVFAVIANLTYLIFVLKGNMKVASAAIAHMGFGLMIIGVLSSGLNKEVISTNPYVFTNIFNKEDVKKYVRLVKNKPMFAQGYWMTYESDTLIGNLRYYEIDFKKTEGEDQKVVEEFKLYPDAVYANDFSKVASFNPDTKHYLHKDIFSCVVALAPTKSDLQVANEFEDTLKYTEYYLTVGDTLHTEKNHYLVDEINFNPEHKEYNPEQNSFGVAIKGRAWADYNPDEVYPFETALGLQGSLLYKYPYIEENLGMRIRPADTLMDMVFIPEEQLNYEPVIFETYGEKEYKGIQINLKGFDQNPSHPSYEPETDDIAVGANLELVKDGKTYTADPIYIIRNNAPVGVKAYIPELGIHIRFTHIDPAEEQFHFYMAVEERPAVNAVPMEIAENIPRTDYIILQANVFPGINLFWLGSMMMMLGLFISWIIHVRSKRRS